MQFDSNRFVESLYIHWPFCPYRCHFCPFVALASHDEYMEQYHEALKKEIIQFGNGHCVKTPIKTIFFGGGTPSTYPPHLLLDTFGILRSIFEFDKDCEITIEVNPGTVSDEKLHTWKNIGVTRLSIGVQSLDDTVLKQLNRHQSARDVFELLDKAKHLFENISLDLILGLPGVSDSAWKSFVKTVVALPIKHISTYFLTVHENTPLYFGVKTNKVVLPADDAVVDLYEWTVQELAAHGFMQYEVSSFAKAGFECRHNSAYWNRKPYKGFGMGACSFDGDSRMQNTKNLMQYLTVQSDEARVVFAEKLTSEQAYLEQLMLGLRQSKGVKIEEVTQGLSDAQYTTLCDTILQISALGYLEHHNGRIRLTGKGLAVEHELIVKLAVR